MRNALQFNNDSITESNYFLFKESLPYQPDSTATTTAQEALRFNGDTRIESEGLATFFPIIMIVFLLLNLVAAYFSEAWAKRGIHKIFALQEKRNKIGQTSVRLERVAKVFFLMELFVVTAYLIIEYTVGNSLLPHFFSEVETLQITVLLSIALLVWCLLRFALMELLGWMYDIVPEIRELEWYFYTTLGLLGIASSVLFVGVQFVGLSVEFALLILLFLVFLSYVLTITLSFRLFWGRILFFLYLFLYLCAAEIMPGVLIYSILDGFGTQFNF